MEVVALLLERGADVNRKTNQEMSPLMLAARDGHEEVVQMLLEAGADITLHSKKVLSFGKRYTAINYASSSEIAKMIREWPEKEKQMLHERWLDETDCGKGLAQAIRAPRPLGPRN